MVFGTLVLASMVESIYSVPVESPIQLPKKSIDKVLHQNPKRMLNLIAESNINLNLLFLEWIWDKRRRVSLRFKHGSQRKVQQIFGMETIYRSYFSIDVSHLSVVIDTIYSIGTAIILVMNSQNIF